MSLVFPWYCHSKNCRICHPRKNMHSHLKYCRNKFFRQPPGFLTLFWFQFQYDYMAGSDVRLPDVRLQHRGPDYPQVLPKLEQLVSISRNFFFLLY